MNLETIKIDPEFVNMVIRTVAGEQSIHDTMTQNAGAAMAHVLRLEKMRKVNGHFIAQICKAHLFQSAVAICMGKLAESSDLEVQRATLHAFTAQAILIGMHMHEQLLDKSAKGLVTQ